ncbi:hypothetical protein Y1Q_0021196 [Alligator mississippiensis]|uniref:Uncharacterized protein n=1 Tax=Alligator mississippiensis TaxID=8496 RepID=A0A151MRV1_ALLMI|nr:hypothetical protein Y1Q_0021196 [Alligator mississippiensis]
MELSLVVGGEPVLELLGAQPWQAQPGGRRLCSPTELSLVAGGKRSARIPVALQKISNLLKEHRVFRRLQLISFPVPCGLAGDLLKMSVTQSGITAIKWDPSLKKG